MKIDTNSKSTRTRENRQNVKVDITVKVDTKVKVESKVKVDRKVKVKVDTLY